MSDSSADRPLSLAFLGCGEVTRLHSRTLAAAGFRVRRYYASQDSDRARGYDVRFHGSGWFHSYDAALQDDRVQIVLVATPPSSHLELTLQALEGGKDVIVEKPAFLRSRDFDAVGELAERSGRRVFVAENYVYKPIASRLRKVIRDGGLGEIRFLQVNALKEQRATGWRNDLTVAGGGAVFEGGIHWISLLGSLGLEVAGVSGTRAGDRSGGDRSALVTFRYEGGAVGTLHFSWEIKAPLRGVRFSRIYGTEGSVLFESNGLFLIRKRWGSLRQIFPRVGIPSIRDLLGYRAMFSDFFRAVRTGTAPLYTLETARRDLERIEEIYRVMDRRSHEDHQEPSRRQR